ncbi:MAG: ATP-dependent helicase HrpB, partial [Myxococcales bacterium]|nr:ATP-dependent helicase HrpB [Myxococcales bacterium]
LTSPDFLALKARVELLREHMPELGLRSIDEEAVRALLPTLAAGETSFASMRRKPFVEMLLGLLDYPSQAALEQHMPERIEVPSGSRIRLDYEPGKPPVLAVRIQEMFGLAETPTVAGGRLRVMLHLLAPNMRPQQVTQDLAGFWARTYPDVRKDLRGRYPKHDWPDDPLSAAPLRGTRRRR